MRQYQIAGKGEKLLVREQFSRTSEEQVEMLGNKQTRGEKEKEIKTRREKTANNNKIVRRSNFA